eukprot:2110162-Rhodomonas_salina.1
MPELPEHKRLAPGTVRPDASSVAGKGQTDREREMSEKDGQMCDREDQEEGHGLDGGAEVAHLLEGPPSLLVQLPPAPPATRERHTRQSMPRQHRSNATSAQVKCRLHATSAVSVQCCHVSAACHVSTARRRSSSARLHRGRG